jgi:hypothetical protein
VATNIAETSVTIPGIVYGNNSIILELCNVNFPTGLYKHMFILK